MWIAGCPICMKELGSHYKWIDAANELRTHVASHLDPEGKELKALINEYKEHHETTYERVA